MKWIALALFATAVETCCDQIGHADYEQSVENAKLCTARQGLAFTKHVRDSGGHEFLILAQCVFPCDQRLAVEK